MTVRKPDETDPALRHAGKFDRRQAGYPGRGGRIRGVADIPHLDGEVLRKVLQFPEQRFGGGAGRTGGPPGNDEGAFPLGVDDGGDRSGESLELFPNGRPIRFPKQHGA